MMSEGAVMTSCLHGGPIARAELARAEELPSWLEREAGLPAGTVARMLKALCRRYGSCGVMAVDADTIVGKVRFSPNGLGEGVPECVQQDAEALAAFDPDSLPAREALESQSLVLWCLQVVDDARYRRRGIATAMLERTIAWARNDGWDEIRAEAIREIPPLLEWTGLLSLDAFLRLGFTPTGTQVSPELLEGVRHMRAGGHGERVREQWQPFAHLRDEDAATLYDVALALKGPPCGR